MISFEMVLIAAVIGLLWFSLSQIQAKEIATLAAKFRCDSRGLLILDQTVVLDRLRLKRDRRGQLQWQRTYRFEFSATGADRYHGTLVLLGQETISAHLDDPLPPSATEPDLDLEPAYQRYRPFRVVTPCDPPAAAPSPNGADSHSGGGDGSD